MIAGEKEPTARSTAVRKIGGYGAATAVTPYLLVKMAWTFGMLLPDESMGGPEWRAINATTALLALVGILLGMAFSRPRGERLPASMVIVPTWVAPASSCGWWCWHRCSDRRPWCGTRRPVPPRCERTSRSSSSCRSSGSAWGCRSRWWATRRHGGPRPWADQ